MGGITSVFLQYDTTDNSSLPYTANSASNETAAVKPGDECEPKCINDEDEDNTAAQSVSIIEKKKQMTTKELLRKWRRILKREIRQIDRDIRKRNVEARRAKREMVQEAQRANGDPRTINVVRVMALSYVRNGFHSQEIYECKAELQRIATELQNYTKYGIQIQYETKHLLSVAFLKIVVSELQIPDVIIHKITLFYECDFFLKPCPKITAAMNKFQHQYLRFISCQNHKLYQEMECAGFISPYYPIMREPEDDERCDWKSEMIVEEKVEKIMSELIGCDLADVIECKRNNDELECIYDDDTRSIQQRLAVLAD